MSTNTIIPQTIELVLADGVHFDEAINEYVVVHQGEIVNYATHQSTAWFQYNEALRARREHRQRNTFNITDNQIIVLEASNV